MSWWIVVQGNGRSATMVRSGGGGADSVKPIDRTTASRRKGNRNWGYVDTGGTGKERPEILIGPLSVERTRPIIGSDPPRPKAPLDHLSGCSRIVVNAGVRG